jgi:hypothetical protein
MKKKIFICVILLLVAIAGSIVIYKRALREQVLSLYGKDTDISGLGIKDLAKMIVAFNNNDKKNGGQ